MTTTARPRTCKCGVCPTCKQAAYVRCHLVRGHKGEPEPTAPGRKPWTVPWPDPSALPWPDLAVVVDAETTIDPEQRLLIGAYVVLLGDDVIDEGIVAADDLPDADRSRVYRYGARHGLDVSQRSDFIRDVLIPIAYRQHHRVVTSDGEVCDHMRGALVAFNAPFDLGALALGWTRVDKNPDYYGGWTLGLLAYRRDDASLIWDRFTPSLHVKALSNGAIFAWSPNAHPKHSDPADLIPEGSTDGRPVAGYRFRGRVLDAKALADALRGASFSLEGACAAFGVPYRKRPVALGLVSDELIAYCLDDARATARLYRAVLAEYARHGLPTRPDRIVTGAGLAKAYLRTMGLDGAPPLTVGPSLGSMTPCELAGIARAAFYAGRAECRVRRWPVPVAHLDFRSMYATTFSLLGLWDLARAERIAGEDATDEARAILASYDAATLADPSAWARLRIICRVEPDDDLLPVRLSLSAHAEHDEAADLHTALDAVRGAPGWWTLADCLASKLLHPERKPPRILRAVRFAPVGRRALRSVRIRGELAVDPTVHDLVRALLVARARRGDDDPLGAYLKRFGNDVAYGLWGEERLADGHPRRERKAPVRAYAGDTRPVRATLPREPVHGDYYCPPIASLVTGGARLILALAEHAVAARGGTVATCITDSLAVVATERGDLVGCPGGPECTPDGSEAIRALSWADVDAIRAELRPLSPSGEDFLRLTRENGDAAGQPRELTFFGVSTLRYCLADRGAGRVVKGSAHVIGTYTPPDMDTSQEDFAGRAWERILTEDGVLDVPDPCWLDEVVTTTRPVVHPDELAVLGDLDAGAARRPFSFATELAKPLFRWREDGVPPIDGRIVQIAEEVWCDPALGETVGVIAPAEWLRRSEADELSGDEVAGYTWRELLRDYAYHPERKMLGPDGERCRRDTRGLLSRPTVAIGEYRPISRSGKVLKGPSERSEDYSDVLAWLRAQSTATIRELTGCKERMAQSVRRGERTPSHEILCRLVDELGDEVAAPRPRRKGAVQD